MNTSDSKLGTFGLKKACEGKVLVGKGEGKHNLESESVDWKVLRGEEYSRYSRDSLQHLRMRSFLRTEVGLYG